MKEGIRLLGEEKYAEAAALFEGILKLNRRMRKDINIILSGPGRAGIKNNRKDTREGKGIAA